MKKIPTLNIVKKAAPKGGKKMSPAQFAHASHKSSPRAMKKLK